MTAHDVANHTAFLVNVESGPACKIDELRGDVVVHTTVVGLVGICCRVDVEAGAGAKVPAVAFGNALAARRRVGRNEGDTSLSGCSLRPPFA